jgi:hypothetical protein
VLVRKKLPDYPGRSRLQPENREELSMESLKRIRSVAVVGILGVVAFCFLHLGVSHAEMPQKPSAKSMQIQKKEPVSGTASAVLKGCPDLKADLTVVMSGNGLLTLSGTVSNVGNADYDMLSVAQMVMNLRYPPKTYNQVGVSEKLVEKSFTKVIKGTSFPVHFTFQLPDFKGITVPAETGNVCRLFTLRVAKQNMAPFAAGEECNPNNNSKSIEFCYSKK